jgi:hypothetical protein
MDTPPAELNRAAIIHNMVDCLNTAFRADPAAVHLLTCHPVRVNTQLADHPHVIVDFVPGLPRMSAWGVTPIGLLNGLLTSAGLPVIATQWDRSDPTHPVLVGFTWREPDEKAQTQTPEQTPPPVAG